MRQVLSFFGLNENAYKIVQEISNFCPAVLNEDIMKEKADSIIYDRVTKFRSWIRNSSHTADALDKATSFVDACTENFMWAGYTQSLAQAIGDRASSEMPKFDIMTPGYSASGMFMAGVKNELRQVVKLSSADKLLREQDNYRQHVRYKLVNAARIPVNGMAFDTRGNYGSDSAKNSDDNIVVPEDMTRRAFGVLVSDLVSGGGDENKTVRTFLTVVAHALVNLGGAGDAFDHWPKIEEIRTASKKLFNDNQKLWKYVPDAVDSTSIYDLVKTGFRLPSRPPIKSNYDDNKDGEPTPDYLFKEYRKGWDDLTSAEKVKEKRLQTLNTSLLAFERFKAEKDIRKIWSDFDFSGPDNMILEDDLKPLYSVVHGDLNARNLTWAAASDSFFLIDFEHVGRGIRGTDQFRLVCNLIAELVEEAKNTKRSYNKTEDIERVFVIVDDGIGYLGRLSENLLRPVGIGKLGTFAESSISDKKSSEEDENDASFQLKRFLYDILDSIEDPNTNTGEQKKWRNYWAFVMFCAALKEFDYCTRMINHEIVEKIAAEEGKIFEKNIRDLNSALENYETPSGDKLTKAEKYLTMRHFVAAKVLHAVSMNIPVSNPDP